MLVPDTVRQRLKSPPVLWGAILLVALWLRWPLPEPGWQHVDEQALVLYPLGFWSGDLNPHFFNYPTFHLYLLSALYYLYFLLFSGESLVSFVAYRYFVDGSDLLALARGLSTLMAVGTVGVTLCLGRRLYGPQGAWMAGLILALMPLQVRFSHLAITDIPAAFWSSLALLWALRLLQEGRRADALLAGFFVGLAAATKYPAALVALPVLGAAGYRSPRLALQAGAVSLLCFALATPYTWLDHRQFWADFATMGQEHLLGGGHRGTDPSWLHLVRYNLRYGLGLVGLLTLGVALVWKPRAWGAGEGVVLACLGVFAVLLLGSQSTFMRYALPLAVPVALLLVRPLQGLSPTRWVLAAWLAALLAEPAYASLQTRLLLSGQDTRSVVRQWLEQQPAGSRIVQDPGRAGDIGVLSPKAIYTRQARFIKSFAAQDLAAAYELLSQREGLPPFYLVGTLKEIGPQVAREAGQVRSEALLLWCDHPLCGGAEAAATLAPLEGDIEWLETLAPGGIDHAVFDPADWYFLPIGSWGATDRSGPSLRLGRIPLRLPGTAPTTQEFFHLLYQVVAGSRAANRQEWPQAARYYQAVLTSPFLLEDLLSYSYLYEMYMNLGEASEVTGAHQQAIRCWLEAARAKPALAAPYSHLGVAFNDLGQHTTAVEYYLKGLALQPNDADLLYNLALSYIHLNHYPEAIEALERSAALKPEPKTYLNLGVSYQKTGQPEKARSCFAKVLELAPDYPQAESIQRLLQRGP